MPWAVLQLSHPPPVRFRRLDAEPDGHDEHPGAVLQHAARPVRPVLVLPRRVLRHRRLCHHPLPQSRRRRHAADAARADPGPVGAFAGSASRSCSATWRPSSAPRPLP